MDRSPRECLTTVKHTKASLPSPPPPAAASQHSQRPFLLVIGARHAGGQVDRKRAGVGPAVRVLMLDAKGLALAVCLDAPGSRNVRVFEADLPVGGFLDVPRFPRVVRFVQLVALFSGAGAAVEHQRALGLGLEDDLLDRADP